MINKPRYIKIVDENGDFTRVLRLHKFPDTSKCFYFEPQFWVKDGLIVRKDTLFEGDDIYGADGCGFLPSNLTEFRKYCQKQYQKFKDDEVLVNRYAIDFLGAKKPPYDDRHVTSVKYWV
ncbi:hypothetical protein [Neisseria meningitidis]|uniref:hypothetical protein n=1 Tax=Neisseria meningitidis TaxID=487 RepID=UPI001C5AA9C9|nr:hypothetical protein [Neisseria meningitidis]MBW3936639.1 hypothetical protein [Neisseria meningitidis]